MKRTLIPLVALTLIIGAPVAFAETGSSTASASLKSILESKKEALKNVQETFKKEVEIKKAEIKKAAEDSKNKTVEAKVEFRAEVAQKSSAHTVTLLNAMADRLQKLIDRVTSRLAKVTAAGGTTTNVQVNLDLAKTDLAKARLQIDAVKTINLGVASTTTSTTTQKAAFDQFKAAVKVVKDTFTAVHKDLQNAIAPLNLSVKNEKEKEATTTTSTTTKSR